MSRDVSKVKFGMMLTVASNEYGLEETTTAEESGFNAVVAGDHVAYPGDIPRTTNT